LPDRTGNEKKALRRIAKLRNAAEIERLLAFMDASDPYASTELEDNNESGDASYPEGGWRPSMGRGHEDDEPDTDDEPV